MRYLFIFAIYALLLTTTAHAQITVSGLIKDSISGERLIGVHVIDQKKNNGVITDNNGYFNIKTEKSASLKFSYIGYNSVILHFEAANDTIIMLNLSAGTNLEEFTIQASSLQNAGTINLDINSIQKMPALGGKPDIAKSLINFPGISTQNEGSALLLVRGGDPGQNMYLFDGVPLIYVNHLGGFASVFDPEMISNINVYKGGFHPSHGGKLSSVIEISQKEGNQKSHKGLISAGLTDLSFLAEGPAPLKNSSYIISGRKTLTEALLYLFTSRSEGNNSIFKYGFHDINAKLSWKPNSKNSIHFNIYQGDDYLSSRTKTIPSRPHDEMKALNIWGNFMSSLRWNSIRNSKLYFTGNISLSAYRIKSGSEQQFLSKDSIQSFKIEKRAEVKDLSARMNWKYSPFSNWMIEFGSQNSFLFYEPVILKNYQNSMQNKSSVTRPMEHAVFINNSLDFGQKWNAQLGLRYAVFINKSFVSAEPEPRIGINYEFLPKKRLNLSYTRMVQNAHLLFNSGSFLNNEIWIPADKSMLPSLANQYSAGFSGLFFKGAYSSELTVFHKNMSRLAAYKEGYLSMLGDENWQSKIETNGAGTSSGLEILLKKNTGDFKGHFAYTFSRTNRNYKGINNGKTFPFDFDRPHNLVASLSYDFNPRLSINLSWTFQSGIPYTPALGRQYAVDFLDDEPFVSEVLVFGEKNSARLKNHHRLDLGVQYQKTTSLGNKAIWSFSVYNLYNQKNAAYYYYSYTDGYGIGQSSPGEDIRQVKLYQMTTLPFFPSFSYKVYFDPNHRKQSNQKKLKNTIKRLFIHE